MRFTVSSFSIFPCFRIFHSLKINKRQKRQMLKGPSIILWVLHLSVPLSNCQCYYFNIDPSKKKPCFFHIVILWLHIPTFIGPITFFNLFGLELHFQTHFLTSFTPPYQTYYRMRTSKISNGPFSIHQKNTFEKITLTFIRRQSTSTTYYISSELVPN